MGIAVGCGVWSAAGTVVVAAGIELLGGGGVPIADAPQAMMNSRVNSNAVDVIALGFLSHW